MLHASNLTGAIMPVEEAGRIARDNGLLFLLDAAQSAGVLPIDVEGQSIDILAFTGHKGLLGPQGTGGIYVRPGVKIRPLKQGGTGSLSEYLEQPDVMPDIFESGTPNTPGLAGLQAGVRWIMERGLDSIRSHEKKLTDMLIQGLREIRGVKLYGPCDGNRQTAVVAFNVHEEDCGEVSQLLDYKYGIVNRSGLHCAPMAHRTIGTLELGSIRLSPGFFTSEADILAAVKAVHDISSQVH